MSLVKLITDNEWKGKYQLLEKQYLADHIEPIISLGDNMPTGPRKNASGSKSFFKTHLKELAKDNPGIKKLPLKEQLALVYKVDPEGFLETYRDAPSYIKRGADFLRQASLPEIIAITGNRAFDYQDLLDFIAEKTGDDVMDYCDQMESCGGFRLYKRPCTMKYEGTGFLFVPYDKSLDESDLEDALEEVEEMQDIDRVVVITHENPDPQQLGVDRPAKMQKVIDYCIEEVSETYNDTVLFCGHLDTSGNSYEYNGISVQPVSGDETVEYDAETGEYEIKEIEDEKDVETRDKK